MPTSSRTTILRILVTAGRALTASQLVALAAPLGISATNLKSHLSRMVAGGVLRRQGRTRLAAYEPTEEQTRFSESVRNRLRERSDGVWDATWMQLTLPVLPSRTQRQRLHAGLWFDGFRLVAPNVYVRPAWPLPWVEHAARAYAQAVAGMCIRGVVLESTAGLESLYDLRGLDSEAAALGAHIRRRVLVKRNSMRAFQERIRIGGQVVQLIANDPRLPDEFLGSGAGMRCLLQAFADFDAAIAEPAAAFIEEVVRASIRTERS